MSERKRMSRAKVAADPRREVFRGVTASLWFVDDPLPAKPRPSAQGGALFRREDIDAAIERGSTLTSAEREALLRGTFDNRPSERRAEPITMETLRDMQRLLSERTIAMPQTIAMSPSLYEELQRFGARRSGDDYTDALDLAWAAGARRDAEANARERERAQQREREAAARRAAQIEREAPWRARVLASIPDPRHITAAELRARVVLPTLRERLGLVTP